MYAQAHELNLLFEHYYSLKSKIHILKGVMVKLQNNKKIVSILIMFIQIVLVFYQTPANKISFHETFIQ